MHERYGEWNSVYIRFRRWGRTVRVRCTPCNPVELGLTDDWQHMIDSTTVRGHSQAAGARGGLVRRLLVDHAAVLRQKSTPARAVKNALFLPRFPSKSPPLASVPTIHPSRRGYTGLRCRRGGTGDPGVCSKRGTGSGGWMRMVSLSPETGRGVPAGHT
nr:hypothetical protein [Rhizobium daejeonense]